MFTSLKRYENSLFKIGIILHRYWVNFISGFPDNSKFVSFETYVIARFRAIFSHAVYVNADASVLLRSFEAAVFTSKIN